MSDNLLLIGKSGAMAARAALDLTAQNIANVDNPDYARRTLSLAEVAAKGGISMQLGAGLSGVRTDRVLRSDAQMLQGQARQAAGDLARAEGELTGLSAAETALEQSGLYSSIVDFEAGLGRLAADPLRTPLREAVLEDARRLAQTFVLAAGGLEAASGDLRFSASAGAEQVNVFAGELARTNAGITRARPGSSNMAALFDQRDALLRDISSLTGAAASFDAMGRASVNIDGQALVAGTSSATLAFTQQADGSLAFSVAGTAANLAGGSLLGQSQALRELADRRGELDALASQVIALTNAAQASGSAPDGTPGQPFFSGTGAADIALALSSGSQLATAPAGAAAGSRDIANLKALREALADNGPAASADAMLFGLSNAISSRSVTRDVLRTIADSAAAALAVETGVDLDQEATNLLRYQQAFQANGRVIQAAADIFDTILGIG